MSDADKTTLAGRDGGSTRSRRALSYSRFVVLIPVIGLFAGAVTLTVLAGTQTVTTIMRTFDGEYAKSDAVLHFIELADVFLLSTVLYIMSLGLFELFIDDTIPLPEWLVIHDLDDLKKKLVGVIAVVLAVSFLGAVVKGAEPLSLLYEGVGIAAVVIAMGYFLKTKHHG